MADETPKPEAVAKTKIKLVYPHAIGDRIELHGVIFNRDGEHHYGYADADLA